VTGIIINLQAIHLLGLEFVGETARRILQTARPKIEILCVAEK
jgi:hypothetical protein